MNVGRPDDDAGPLSVRACIVNHNTSEFAELAVRSLVTAHRTMIDSGRLKITIMDNHSTDQGLPALVRACADLGVEFARSRWPAGDSATAKINSHGDVMRDFVADRPDATHFLFADADSYVIEDGTVGRMAAELEDAPGAWAVQARFSWLEEYEGPGSSRDLWRGRTQQLRVAVDDAETGTFPGRHKARCHPAFALVRNTGIFRRVADVIGLSSAVIMSADPDVAGFADTFGPATLAMQTHGLDHLLSAATVGHYHGVSYPDPHQPLGGKLEDCRRRLAEFRRAGPTARQDR